MSYLSFVDLSGKTLSSGAFDWNGLLRNVRFGSKADVKLVSLYVR